MLITRNLIWGLVWSGLVVVSIIYPLDGRTGVFRDDFEDGNFDGWRVEFHALAGLWEIVDGAVESKRPSPASTYLITGKENWRDYTISYDVMLKENFGRNTVGFIVRFQQPKFSRYIEIWSGDWAGFAAVSTQRFPGNFRTDKPFPLLKLNQWHQMKLEVKGNRFTFWINNQKVLLHKDEAVKRGEIGLSLAGYTARFDNIEISGPEVPDFTPPTWKAKSVEAQNKLAMTWAILKRNSQ